MVKAVIFDLDGVLVSTDMLHYEAWKQLAEQLEIHNFTLEDNVRQRGVSRMASLEILLEKSDKVYSEEEKAELANIKNRIYVESLSKLSEESVLPGVREVFLVAAGKLGIVPENCLVIEDSDAGIQAAKNGKMCALAVGSARKNPIADMSSESLERVKNIISE